MVDDSGPTPRETGEAGTKLTPEVVDLLNESSSGETDHSSDFSDETDVDENKDEQSVRGMVRLLKVVDACEHVSLPVLVCAQRQYHNAQEKKRRKKLGQLFDTLRMEMGHSKSWSRATTLEKV